MKVEITPEKPTEATVHLRKNWLGRVADVFVRLVAKSAEVLDSAISTLKQIFSASPQISLAEALLETRAKLRSLHPEMSDDDFKAYATQQAHTIQIIDLVVPVTVRCS